MVASDEHGSPAQYFGRAIAAARSELGLKRMDLKDRSGLSYPYIAEIENGGKYPSQQAIQKLAAALQLQPSELLARAEQLTPGAAGGVTGREPVEQGARSATTLSPPGAGQDAVSRISDEVFAALEPRIREWLRMEIRMAVQRELQEQSR